MPTYYVMDKDKGMAATVAPFMPSAAEIAACQWLTEDEVGVYAAEYARTGFNGALQGYRVRRGADPQEHRRDAHVLRPHHRRAVDVRRRQERLGHLPDAGRAGGACAAAPARNMVGFHLVEGAGHWVQQEQPEQVSDLLIKFLQDQAQSAL